MAQPPPPWFREIVQGWLITFVRQQRLSQWILEGNDFELAITITAESLPLRTWLILHERQRGSTLEQIGATHHVSKERIRQVIKRASTLALAAIRQHHPNLSRVSSW